MKKLLHCTLTCKYTDGDTIEVRKYVAVLSSTNHPVEGMARKAMTSAGEAARKGFDAMLESHKKAWRRKMGKGDIVIRGRHSRTAGNQVQYLPA